MTAARLVTMSEDQLTTLVKSAAAAGAAEGVREAFLKIGIDISTPEGVIKAQRDWDHLRGWRKASDAFKKSIVSKAGATIWTLFIAGIGLAIANAQGLFSR